MSQLSHRSLPQPHFAFAQRLGGLSRQSFTEVYPPPAGRMFFVLFRGYIFLRNQRLNYFVSLCLRGCRIALA
jgi:hypothetical protein